MAAAIGAAIWAVLVVQTGYEVGFAAVGIGYLAGEGVLIGARHARGVSLQVAAVVCAALGVVLGKYATFEHVLHDTGNSQYGSAEAARVSLLSSDVMRTFWEARSDVFSGFDLLWVGFAVLTAWRIPSVARGLATR